MNKITEKQLKQLFDKHMKPPVIHGNMIMVNGAWINLTQFDKALKNHIKDETNRI